MHFNLSQQPWLQGIGAVFALLAALHVHAQDISNEAAPPASMEQFKFRYQSELRGYQPYADSSIESWTQANQRVQEIGGWKAYAKETFATPVDQKNSEHHKHSMPIEHSHGGHP